MLLVGDTAASDEESRDFLLEVLRLLNGSLDLDCWSVGLFTVFLLEDIVLVCLVALVLDGFALSLPVLLLTKADRDDFLDRKAFGDFEAWGLSLIGCELVVATDATFEGTSDD